MIAIDPGVRALGWCVGDTRIQAAGCSIVPSGALHMMAQEHAGHIAWRTFRVIVESMEANGARVSPQDLIDVQTVGLLTAARLTDFGEIIPIPPSEWKGSVPKDIHQPRFLSALDPQEAAIVKEAAHKAGKTHAKEVWDAVGLYLFHVGRTRRDGMPK